MSILMFSWPRHVLLHRLEPWTGRDRGVRLRQCVDNGHVPCHCFATVAGYQCAAAGAFAVIIIIIIMIIIKV